ncbi:hypothetical protein XENOCAPTIV_022262 [Xenoophorus captivus]|uniref:Uncharacterized protein n=1 Tax=Xenoophorus captivus TaxID=1517983 RepID=A0ABV0RZY0_9TELE
MEFLKDIRPESTLQYDIGIKLLVIQTVKSSGEYPQLKKSFPLVPIGFCCWAVGGHRNPLGALSTSLHPCDRDVASHKVVHSKFFEPSCQLPPGFLPNLPGQPSKATVISTYCETMPQKVLLVVGRKFNFSQQFCSVFDSLQLS